jgi:hypothetical protein
LAAVGEVIDYNSSPFSSEGCWLMSWSLAGEQLIALNPNPDHVDLSVDPNFLLIRNSNNSFTARGNRRRRYQYLRGKELRMPKKALDSRIPTLIRNTVQTRHRSFFIIVGDKARDQVVHLHHILSLSRVSARPKVIRRQL